MDDDNYAAFQQWLAQHPEAGDVIQNTGGLRKIRLACGGQGKRSGARVIYYHFVRRSHIAMLLVYPKNAMDDLTESQKKSLKHLIDTWR